MLFVFSQPHLVTRATIGSWVFRGSRGFWRAKKALFGKGEQKGDKKKECIASRGKRRASPWANLGSVRLGCQPKPLCSSAFNCLCPMAMVNESWLQDANKNHHEGKDIHWWTSANRGSLYPQGGPACEGNQFPGTGLELPCAFRPAGPRGLVFVLVQMKSLNAEAQWDVSRKQQQEDSGCPLETGQVRKAWMKSLNTNSCNSAEEESSCLCPSQVFFILIELFIIS